MLDHGEATVGVEGDQRARLENTPKGTSHRTMKNSILLAGLLVLGTVTASFGKEFREDKKPDFQKFGRSKIVVRQVLPGKTTIGGTLPPQETAEREARKFFGALESLPESFIQHSGLKYVTFLDNPTFKSLPVGGLACGDTIILHAGFTDKTVYHELFHIFDSPQNDPKWRKINDSHFIYTGSPYHEAVLSKVKNKRKDQNVESHAFDHDFVSNYAMSNELEDRAETFAFMVSEKQAFLERAKKSPVLWKKMNFIMDATDKSKLLGKEFWKRTLGVDDMAGLSVFPGTSPAMRGAPRGEERTVPPASARAAEATYPLELVISAPLDIFSLKIPSQAEPVGRLKAGMTVRVLEEATEGRVRVRFRLSTGQVYEGAARKADLHID